MSLQTLRRPALGATAAALLALVAGNAFAASGDDGVGGYRWFDTAEGATPGPGFFDPSGTTTNPADDSEPIGPIDMGFGPSGFPFFGATPTELWISDNGWVSFQDPGVESYPTPPADIPLPDLPNAFIAPFWADLIMSDTAAGHRLRYGRVDSQQAFRVQWDGAVESSGQRVIFDLYLYSDGRIKFHYGLGADATVAAIGIENWDGTVGIEIAAGGVTAPGVPTSIVANYAIDFTPPPVLVGLCASIPEVACGRIDGSLPDGLAGNVQAYSCSPAAVNAREQVYSFVLTEASVVSATLTPGTATNMRLFLLEACNETRCITGGTALTTGELLLAAGRYYVVVDAASEADEGTFSLDLACAPFATPIACGDVVNGDTSGATNRFNTSPCAAGRSLSGGEAWYSITVAAETNLRATLSGLTEDLDILLVRADANQQITAADCLTWGDLATVGWAIPPGDYLLLVEGFQGAEGPFTLATDCGIDVDCSSPVTRIDMSDGRLQVLSGDTSTGTNAAELYRCDLSALYTGPEVVYEIFMPVAGQIALRQTSGTPGLAFFVLDSCNEGSCTGVAAEGIGCGAQLDAGFHYIVVDGANGASGPFEAELVYEEEFNRWTACQDPGGGTSIEDVSRTEWNFDDGAYCYTDPASRNHPDGCTFAMYVTAPCGTEMHLPLFDVEGGHIRIFDVFKGEYMDLTAESTGSWGDSGTEIQWEDCAGTDTQWNNQTTDIWFRRDEGLCGIFRLEFVKHSGFIWDLFANCAGTNTPQFNIHADLCTALADYNPLPNVSISSANATYNCPDIQVAYDLRNDGCLPARDVEVSLFDNGVLVTSQIVPEIEGGGLVSMVLNGTFTSTDTSGVELRVDVANTIVECNESEGAACDVQAGADRVVLADCSTTCRVSASGVLSATRACEGDVISVDASGSVGTNCTGGVLEYQLTGPGLPGGWQLSPDFSFPATATGDYTIEARCADPLLAPTCSDAWVMPLTVDLPPLFDAASVTATDICNGGIVLSWAPATWRGPAGAGYYNIYRSTVSCADARSTPGNLLESGLLGVTTWEDTLAGTGEAGGTYYYVVEAEDGTGNTRCVPAGPTVRGATTRVDASGGTCTAVTDGRGQDPATLPRVGESLRLGGGDAANPLHGEDFVTLRWTTDVPIDPALGHHFHVLRSTVPDPLSAFTQINPEPPLLQVGQFTDTNAAQPDTGTQLFFYLVFTSDGCEADNRDFDNFRSVP